MEEDGREVRYGRPSERVPFSSRVTVKDPAFYVQAVLGGTIGMGESYRDGAAPCRDALALQMVLARPGARETTILGRLD